ncbi:DUF58 domain-containing protein [[Bacillus] enclensis]|uniref:DUF58 domain-containing protein n=1 Tax=[Bacillus] enclensis TaxID=1402860 RepID=UPI0005094957|nr:DUF58 domain-containing protein [[Bacillus] enclensis]MBH9968465.1 DUF58 domain-containing protein [[Bacillus] enclensis]QWC23120.1 DUF58 domain-containing protein [Bacillus haikouensis]
MKNKLQILKPIGKLLLLLLLIAITFTYAMFQGGFVSWFLFYSFIPFALYSLFVFFYPLSDFYVERRFESLEYKAGDELKVTLTLRRKVPFPLFYMVLEDVVTESLFRQSAFQKAKSMIYPGFRREVKLSYFIDELPRGEHLYSAVRLKTGDFFGVFEKEAVIECKDQLLVYPSFVEVQYRPLENRYDQGMTSSNVKIQKDTTMATGVRSYQPGDRFSWIHWKSFARTNELMTKEFEERQSHDVLIVLDREYSAAFEPMVTFTASVIRSIIKKGAQVGLVSIGEDHQSFPIRGGEEHQGQLFYHLAKVQPDSRFVLGKVLQGEGLNYSQSAAVFFVTAEVSKKMIMSVNNYTKRSSSVVIFLVKAKGESYTDEEKALKAYAASRGIWLKACYDGDFSSAFAEVKRA